MQDVLNLRLLINMLVVAEPVLTGAVLFAFFRSREQRRFPALRNYLVLRLAIAVALGAMWVSVWFGVKPRAVYPLYFYTYYSSYIAGAIATFLVIQEMFKHLMAPLPGISRLGLLAFRWAATISIIVAVASALMPSGFKGRMIVGTSIEFMRCVSIMELCLLALLAFSVHSLGLSFRSRAFGVGLGFGIMATMEFVNSVFAIGQRSMISLANGLAGAVTVVALVTWTVYFLRPEAARKRVTLPMTSPLMRWNEIAMALGHASPQVVVVPASQFFLQDVEKVVDKMLSKNANKAMNSANQQI